MVNQVDMPTCTDTWTHSNQDAGPEKGSMAHIKGAIEGYTCPYITMNGAGADMMSEVDMHTCPDACTHYFQGVGPEEGWLEYTGSSYLHATMSGGGAYIGSQVDMYTFTDACTYCDQGVGPEDYPGIDPHSVTTYKINNGSGTVVLTLAWCFYNKYLSSL